MNYCLDHQGNGSHYAKDNCAMCRLLRDVGTIRTDAGRERAVLSVDDAQEILAQLRRLALKDIHDSEFVEGQKVVGVIVVLNRAILDAS